MMCSMGSSDGSGELANVCVVCCPVLVRLCVGCGWLALAALRGLGLLLLVEACAAAGTPGLALHTLVVLLLLAPWLGLVLGGQASLIEEDGKAAVMGWAVGVGEVSKPSGGSSDNGPQIIPGTGGTWART